LVHVIDPLGYEKAPKANVKIINDELKKYSPVLARKPQIVVVNKQDLTGADKTFKEIKRAYRSQNVLAVSGVSGQGIQELLAAVSQELDRHPRVVQSEKMDAPVHVKLEPDFRVLKEGDLFVVKGKKVETLVAMTNFKYEDATERTQNILKKMGVERALAARGAVPGDQVQIGGMEFTFEPAAVNRSWPRR